MSGVGEARPRRRRHVRQLSLCLVPALLVMGGCAASEPRDDVARTAASDQVDPLADAADGARRDPTRERDGEDVARDDELGDDEEVASDGQQDGAASSTLVVVDGRLPADFPDDVPLPEPREVTMATESQVAGGHSYVVQMVTPGEPRTVFDELAERFAPERWQELQRSTSNLGSSPTGSATYSSDELLVNVGTIAGEAPGTVTVSYSVLPTSPSP